jgi:hypothetical protein
MFRSVALAAGVWFVLVVQGPAQGVGKGAAKAAPAAAPYVGDRKTQIYHLKACSEAAKLRPADRVPFNKALAAVEAGYQPCPTCEPDADDPEAALRASQKAEFKRNIRKRADELSGKTKQRQMTLAQQRAWMRQLAMQATADMGFARLQLAALQGPGRDAVAGRADDLQRQLNEADARNRSLERELSLRQLSPERRQQLEQEQIRAMEEQARMIQALTNQLNQQLAQQGIDRRAADPGGRAPNAGGGPMLPGFQPVGQTAGQAAAPGNPGFTQPFNRPAGNNPAPAPHPAAASSSSSSSSGSEHASSDRSSDKSSSDKSSSGGKKK